MKKLSDIDFTNAYNDLHLGRKMTPSEIGRVLGCHRETVRRAFLRLGLSVVEYTHRDYSRLDTSPIFKLCPNTAYWLGFLAADGSVNDTKLTVHLKESDLSHLKTLASYLCIPTDYASLKSRILNGKVLNYASLSVSHYRLVDWLNKFGILQNKSSYDIDFLSYLPEDLWLPFVAGYLDGDGSVSVSYKSNFVTVSFLGSNAFIRSLAFFFRNLGVHGGSSIHRSNGLYELSYSGREGTEILLNAYLKFSAIALPRKVAKAQEGLMFLSSFSTSTLRSSLNCRVCGSTIEHNSFHRVCSSCISLSKRKVVRPSKEELRSLLDRFTYTSIGRKYGVSDNAVRKWAKGYGLL